jgi:PPOX class probable F420-dependent enzyme
MVLDPKVVSFLTGEPRCAVLATINRDGSIQQTVIWFDLDGDQVVMNTLRGRVKDRNILRDPRVSVCVEDGQNYVTLKGRAEMIDDPELGQSNMRQMTTKYRGAEEAEKDMAEIFSKQERVVIRVTVDSVDVHGF